MSYNTYAHQIYLLSLSLGNILNIIQSIE